jgi:hypothetical protein
VETTPSRNSQPETHRDGSGQIGGDGGIDRVTIRGFVQCLPFKMPAMLIRTFSFGYFAATLGTKSLSLPVSCRSTTSECMPGFAASGLASARTRSSHRASTLD